MCGGAQPARARATRWRATQGNHHAQAGSPAFCRRRTRRGAARAAARPRAQAPGGPPPKVTVAKPVVREIVEQDQYTGRFDPIDFVEVRARVTGYLEKINFMDGATVKKGDLLFVIDRRPYKAALEQAQAGADLGQGPAVVLADRPRARADPVAGRQHLRAGHRPAPAGLADRAGRRRQRRGGAPQRPARTTTSPR